MSADELLSDSFPYKEIQNGALWEVDGKVGNSLLGMSSAYSCFFLPAYFLAYFIRLIKFVIHSEVRCSIVQFCIVICGLDRVVVCCFVIPSGCVSYMSC